MYLHWWAEKLWSMIPAQAIVGKFLATFKGYPPSQVSSTLSLERALAMLQSGSRGSGA